jgi:hypothetical protein
MPLMPTAFVVDSGGSDDGWTEVVKQADQSSVTTTLAPDDELLFTADLDAVYEINATLIYSNAAGGPDLKIAVGEDSTARGQVKTIGLNTSDGASGADIRTNQADTAIHGSAVAERPIVFLGAHIGGGGTWVLLWAQGTGNATATVVKAGSVLRYRRLLGT